MARKTVADLNVDVAALATQWTDFLKVAPTKADLLGLATKADVKAVVKTELETFKADMRQSLKEDMDQRFKQFKAGQDAIQKDTDTRVAALEKKLDDKIVEVDAKSRMQDMYYRRLNFLLIGEKEKEGTWKETNKDSLEIVQKYLSLMIPFDENIQIVDCHRLGKKKNELNAQGKPICRPIIFRVADMFQVRTIRDNLKTLKKYFTDNPSENKVYFRRHLPQQMYLQRKELQPKYTELFSAGREPKWELDNNKAKFYIVDKLGNAFR